ncbi:MAG: cytochrome c family protein [Rhodospirillales bacterium]|jgi:cytochrome c|nr:cytochrome c family protein [Rhodospirillales bacterium]
MTLLKSSRRTGVRSLTSVCVALAFAAAPALAQEPDKGERVFKKCQACHALAPGEHTDKGPSLHGIFGRKAGTAEGYAYSEAMKAATVVWSEETLDAFLADAQGVVPGNTMNFSALRKPEDRTAVIAYLRRAAQ